MTATQFAPSAPSADEESIVYVSQDAMQSAYEAAEVEGRSLPDRPVSQ